MREIPPDSLLARLIEFRLCTPRDLQRARGIVRRMTRDLPEFDSVWIDALTQIQVLTPFQARWLEEKPPESLVAGPYVLLDGLGSGTASRTFLAASANRQRVVLKQLVSPPDQQSQVELRLQLLIERSRQVRSPQLAVPVELVRDRDRSFVVSRNVPGLNLSELLMRRGRFPAAVVMAIADQLLIALAAWHSAGLVHGDLRLTKLRLTDQGLIVIVDCGVAGAVEPELMVHAIQNSEMADVIAPERIGTNQAPTAASDLYSVGCLLWQLLTGRPPFATADPLSKLALHQTRRIPDVRSLAPDTPAALAELISVLTAPHPQDRPTGAEAARRRCGLRGKPSLSGLARFRRRFDVAVPHLAVRSHVKSRRWRGLSAAVVLLGLAVFALSDRGLRTGLLAIAQRALQETDATTSGTVGEKSATLPESLSLPEPDRLGVMTLQEPGPYSARELTVVGPLTIQAAKGVTPVVLVDDEPLALSAQHVILKGIQLERRGGISNQNSALLQLRTQRVQISDCRFIGPESSTVGERLVLKANEIDGERREVDAAVHHPGVCAVCWEPADRRDPQAGQLEFRNCQFHGAMSALECLQSPREIRWQNVLKSGAQAALTVNSGTSAHELSVFWEHVTLRSAGAAIACSGSLAEHPSTAVITIEAENCVLAVEHPASLIQWIGPQVRADWPQAVRWSGESCLIPPGTSLAATFDPQTGTTLELDSEKLEFEGLFADELQFAGPFSSEPLDAVLTQTRAPRRADSLLPGIVGARWSK